LAEIPKERTTCVAHHSSSSLTSSCFSPKERTTCVAHHSSSSLTSSCFSPKERTTCVAHHSSSSLASSCFSPKERTTCVAHHSSSSLTSSCFSFDIHSSRAARITNARCDCGGSVWESICSPLNMTPKQMNSNVWESECHPLENPHHSIAMPSPPHKCFFSNSSQLPHHLVSHHHAYIFSNHIRTAPSLTNTGIFSPRR
jgi:hypothetical protein